MLMAYDVESKEKFHTLDLTIACCFKVVVSNGCVRFAVYWRPIKVLEDGGVNIFACRGILR